MTRDFPMRMTLPEAIALKSTGSDALREVTALRDVKALTVAITRGDEEAFNVFYAEYSPRIYRFLLAVTRGDAAVGRELHQAVMIKAARKLKVFESEGSLWAWLTTVGRNEWKDLCRKRAREAQRAGGDEIDLPARAAATDEERCQELNEALLELSGADRELVESFYLDEVSQAELAQRSGRTAKAVQCALARIRLRLKHFIEVRR
jgi:RNA polymerase sigma-70 factor (ECF subfamily)